MTPRRPDIAALATCVALALPTVADTQTTSRRDFTVDASSTDVRNDCTFSIEAGAGSDEARVFRVGCVEANIVWPPAGGWTQSYDNLAFGVDVINHAGSESVTILTFADALLVGAQTISTPAPQLQGELRARTLWPFPGTFDVSIRYFTPDGPVDAVGDSILPDQGLFGGVKVHNLQFWNLTDPFATVDVPVGEVRRVVDRVNDYVYSHLNDDSIDAIYGQCPTSSHSQFRFAGLGDMTINANCVDMTTWTGSANNCGAMYQTCINAIFAQVLAADANLTQLHIVFVDNYGSTLCSNAGSSGTHRLITNYNGSDPDPANHGYMILIEDQVTANADFMARLLAHEVGHTYLGGHTNNNNTCPGTPPTRNLMCRNTGRLINSTQCQSAAANTNLRYQDQN